MRAKYGRYWVKNEERAESDGASLTWRAKNDQGPGNKKDGTLTWSFPNFGNPAGPNLAIWPPSALRPPLTRGVPLSFEFQ